MRLAWPIAVAALLASVAPAQAQQGRWFPQAGSRPYQYQLIQRIAGRADEGYRLDYDLEADAKGGLVAVVRRAQHLANGQWAEAAIDETCRAALHAGKGELARVTLLPLAPDAATGLGEPFLALCAPADLVFPMFDILNVALVQSSRFGIDALAAPGDSHRYPAFTTNFLRGNFTGTAASPGGTIRFASLDAGRATIDWAPEPMALNIVLHGGANGADMRMEGTENFAFRVTVDRRTGALLGATTPFDKLNVIMDIKDAPPIPITISRDVTIAPRAP